MAKKIKNTDVPFTDAYPRPQLVRSNWINLNGSWNVGIDEAGRWTHPQQVKWSGNIVVPFAPESPLSGLEQTGYFHAVWYRRAIDAPKLAAGQRLVLHFGAVDYLASVWVNGRLVARHEGGYTPFSADITDVLTKGPQEVVVCASDDPHDLAKPRGKQDWLPDPHGIWYYRTSGIWQTVWMEVVPETHIAQLRWTPSMEHWSLDLEARVGGPPRGDLKLSVTITSRNQKLADDTYAIPRDEISRTIKLLDPGIDDARNFHMWFPWAPNLMDVTIRLTDAQGRVIDTVQSYTAIRQATVLGNRFVFNGKPMQLQLVLDQGYWPEGGLTAPDDAAYRRDVELVKQMGFNGVRKHQKIENPRFLYWADKLGLLVWEEMPSPYRFNEQTIRRITTQWTEAIHRDISHPCIIAWVPINESWGVPDLPHVPAQRHLVQAIYHLTKSLDPSRACIGNDGWEAAATDIVAIHDYESNPERLKNRYGGDTQENILHMLANHRPGHKVLLLEGFGYQGQPIMLTEFGGIAYSKHQAGTWGYSRAGSPDDLAHRYHRLLDTVRSVPIFAGFCYTQFTDTYQEANGLLYMDRTPKFDLDEMSIATRGARTEREHQIEAKWRERMLAMQR